MTEGEKINLVGICIAAGIAAVNLGWTIFAWYSARKSPGAEKLEEGRRTALRDFRNEIAALRDGVHIHQFATPEELAAWPSVVKDRKVTVAPITLLFALNRLQERIAEHLHSAERDQLANLCIGAQYGFKHEPAYYCNDAGNAETRFVAWLESFQRLDRWALDLLSAASIDRFLKGDPVIVVLDKDS